MTSLLPKVPVPLRLRSQAFGHLGQCAGGEPEAICHGSNATQLLGHSSFEPSSVHHIPLIMDLDREFEFHMSIEIEFR